MNRAQGGARGGAGDGARTRTRAARARTRTHTHRALWRHTLSLSFLVAIANSSRTRVL